MTKDEIASLIMNRFRETSSRPKHTIDERWINFNLINKLNPKEQQLVAGAISKLESEGLIKTTYINGLCLVLTQKGFEHIYLIDTDATKTKIEQMILSAFAKQNSKPNHILDQRWITFNLMNKLNPREVDLVDESIEDLKTKEFITTENRNGMFCLVLTDRGFEYIYS
jgi:hypothetical protein